MHIKWHRNLDGRSSANDGGPPTPTPSSINDHESTMNQSTISSNEDQKLPLITKRCSAIRFAATVVDDDQDDDHVPNQDKSKFNSIMKTVFCLRSHHSNKSKSKPNIGTKSPNDRCDQPLIDEPLMIDEDDSIASTNSDTDSAYASCDNSSSSSSVSSPSLPPLLSPKGDQSSAAAAAAAAAAKASPLPITKVLVKFIDDEPCRTTPIIIDKSELNQLKTSDNDNHKHLHGILRNNGHVMAAQPSSPSSTTIKFNGDHSTLSTSTSTTKRVHFAKPLPSSIIYIV